MLRKEPKEDVGYDDIFCLYKFIAIIFMLLPISYTQNPSYLTPRAHIHRDSISIHAHTEILTPRYKPTLKIPITTSLPVSPTPQPMTNYFFFFFFSHWRQSCLFGTYLSPDCSAQYRLLVIMLASLSPQPAAFNSLTALLYRHSSRPNCRPMQPHLYWT